MQRIYEPAAYDDTSIAGSYWRTTAPVPDYPAAEGDQSCDIAIIGAGFTGLSAALHLAQSGAGRILVLDAHQPGWGASGRNGGFCCIGGAKMSDAGIRKAHGQDALSTYQNATRASVDLVADLLEQHSIDADTHSKGETLLAHRASDMPSLRADAAQFIADYGLPATVIEREALADHGLSSPQFHGAMTLPIGFALNPYKYVLGLARAATSAGAEILANSSVTAQEYRDNAHILTTPTARITAKKLLIATNGYSSETLPKWLASRYLPVQSSVLVTRKITPDEQQAQGWSSTQMCYDTRHLLHYFRLMPNGRMLFGMRGGVRANPSDFTQMRRDIRADFDAMFPTWSAVDTPHFWAGLVCLARDLVPFVGAIPDMPNAYASLAYHGNGVAFATYSGRLMADIMLGKTPGSPYPAFLATPPRRFPLGRHRRTLLRAAYHLYSFQDRG